VAGPSPPSAPARTARHRGDPAPDRSRATPDDTTADSSAFEASLTALGFQPVAQPREDGVTYCLRNCPYRDAVRENQPAICALHKGITRGLLDVLAPKAKLSGFVPHDPDRAGCLIELRGLSTPAK
jgi:predicted ArsR family transcriptional regulator